MIWRDAIHLGWRNLRQTPLRTALTVTGVAIGIGTLVCMFGFGLGLQRLNTEEISRYRFLNAIQVLPMDMGIPMGARNAKDKPPKAAALNEDALAALRKLPGVAAATPVIQFPVELKKGDRSRSGMGRSFEPAVDGANPLYKLTAGRFFRDAHAREVVVTGAALSALGFKDFRQATGREITLVLLSTPSGRRRSPSGWPACWRTPRGPSATRSCAWSCSCPWGRPGTSGWTGWWRCSR
jgi:ABC-type lipoprotein release transport system permease subunit